MNAREFWWRLPGPHGFLMRALRVLEDGESLILMRPAHAPEDLPDALAHLVPTSSALTFKSLSLRDGDDVEEALGRCLEAGRPLSALAALTDLRFGYTVLRLTDRAGGPPPASAMPFIAQFLSEVERLRVKDSGTPRLRLWMDSDVLDLKRNGQGRAGAFQIVCWHGAVAASDMAAYSALLMIDRVGPGPWRLYEAIVREFSGFDRSLAEHLAALSNGELLDVVEALKVEAKRTPVRWERFNWARGCTDMIDGRVAVHPLADAARLAGGGSQAIESRDAERRLRLRLWKAQLTEVYPWLEEHRPRALALHEDLIRDAIDAGMTGYRDQPKKTPEDFEYGDIITAIHEYRKGQRPRELSPVCHFSAKARNQLAHRWPLSVGSLQDLLDAWEPLL